MGESVPPRPAFSDLPLRKDGPRGNIWGLFGDNDELGLLNYLTEDVVRNAAKEVKFGIKIGVDLPLNHFASPMYSRPKLEHKIIRAGEHTVNDDTITINTQGSTQWDGFRHFGYQDYEAYYNGCKQEEIENSNRIGIHAWAQKGGIVTRGVLLDYARWATAHSIEPRCLETFEITADVLRQVAQSQGISLRTGDVLLIRSGFLNAHKNMDEAEEKEWNGVPLPTSIGLESSEETLRFLWDSGVVAVAGDMPALEAWPWTNREWWLHEWLLAGWGCPIGELFDLERLGAECERLRKWTFMFSSTPLNVPGGVASPPNGIAIL